MLIYLTVLVTRLHLPRAIHIEGMYVEVTLLSTHTGNGDHSWYLSISLPLPVGFPIQNEKMNVARSAPQGDKLPFPVSSLNLSTLKPIYQQRTIAQGVNICAEE